MLDTQVRCARTNHSHSFYRACRFSVAPRDEERSPRYLPAYAVPATQSNQGRLMR
jgi:hypothetical protein